MAKATGAAKFRDGHVRVSLFQKADDLLIVKSGLFHSRYSPKLAVFVPSFVTILSMRFKLKQKNHIKFVAFSIVIDFNEFTTLIFRAVLRNLYDSGSRIKFF